MDNQNMAHPERTGLNGMIMVFVLGSVLGFSEVIIGGLLHRIGFPYRAGLLTGIGFALAGFCMAFLEKPVIALSMGLIAVLCKQMVVPLLNVSVMCKMNSCIAVLLEYGALSGIAALTIGRMKRGTLPRILTGASAAFAGSIAFYFIGMHVAPCRYLLSFNSAGGFVSYLLKESLIWTLFSALFFPIGWMAGERLKQGISSFITLRATAFYMTASLIVVFSWTICAVALYFGI